MALVELGYPVFLPLKILKLFGIPIFELLKVSDEDYSRNVTHRGRTS
jgi:hypothetical protein